jgi:hypothetical protein
MASREPRRSDAGVFARAIGWRFAGGSRRLASDAGFSFVRSRASDPAERHCVDARAIDPAARIAIEAV